MTVRKPSARRKVPTCILAMLISLALAGLGNICIALPAAAASETVYLQNVRTLNYGGYGTGDFIVKDCVAYCAEPAKSAPSTGYYSAQPLYTRMNSDGEQNDRSELARVLWYGYGGPGYSPSFYPETDHAGNPMTDELRQALTHIVIADVFASDGDRAMKGTTSSFKNWANAHILCWNTGVYHEGLQSALMYTASEPPMPAEFIDSCFVVETGAGTQAIVGHAGFGKLKVSKRSSNVSISGGNASYSLEGAKFGVYLDPECTQLAAELATDSAGNCESGWLPSRDYYVRETQAPRGFELDTRSREVRIGNGGTYWMDVDDNPLSNAALLMLLKHDAEVGLSNANHPLGGASLEGAEYSLDYYDGDHDSANSAMSHGKRQRHWIFKTDATGSIRFNDPAYRIGGDPLYKSLDGKVAFPLGSYVLRETKPPEGYLISDSTFFAKVTRKGNGTEVAGDVSEKPWNLYDENLYVGDSEQVKRGDLRLVKVRETDMHRLAKVPFSITSQTTGERHVLVTDENGMADTSSSWNAHSDHSNSNDAVLADGSYACNPDHGIWFGSHDGGLLTCPDDALGALPYDTYTLEELPCEANVGCELLSIPNITIKRDKLVVDLGTVDDPEKPIPSIRSIAIDAADGDGLIASSEDAMIIDKIEYANLEVGETYTLRAALADPLTGEMVECANGIETFTAEGRYGETSVKIPVDLTGLQSSKVVVLERLERNGVTEARDESLDNADQTLEVLLPQIQTKASDRQDGDQGLVLGSDSGISDHVEFSNLIPGRSYRLLGRLMSRNDDGTVVALQDESGEDVTSQVEFVAGSPDGETIVSFPLEDAIVDDVSKIVVYETLYLGVQEVAAHEDANSIEQTVDILSPSLRTSATDGELGLKEVQPDQDVTIVDVIEYENLVPSKTYRIVSSLHMKSYDEEGASQDEGSIRSPSGEEIAVESEFVPESASGQLSVQIPISTAGLPNTSIVVFEELWCDGGLVAEHCDINDWGQTVEVASPAMETTAMDALDGDKELFASMDAKVVDIIRYSHLMPGTEYTIVGTLMSKSTGEPMDCGSGAIESATTFVPTEPSGEVRVEFDLDASGLEDDFEAVAFERLHSADELIAEHADIDSESQTVRVVQPKAGSTYDKTGVSSLGLIVALALLASGLLSWMALLASNYQKRRVRRSRHLRSIY